MKRRSGYGGRGDRRGAVEEAPSLCLPPESMDRKSLLWTIGGLSMAFSGFIGLKCFVAGTSQNVMIIITISNDDSTVGGK